ncbi:MAG: DNA primase, partial [Candidatus Melainabacteria bacterium GWA2_34_9]
MRRKIGSNKNSMVQKSNINTPVIDAVSEIKNRLDIVDVISEHIALKKSGRNYWGCCPFHKEKTPSFSISPDKGIFKCFGCGVGGDAISFLMKINNNTFYEVIVEQAQKFGIPIQTQNFSPEKTEIKNQILEVNQEAVSFFNKLLLDAPEAAKARDYLFKRNITEEVIEKFNIGYSLNSYDSLIKHFQDDKIELLNKAGLVSEKSSGKGYLDRFRGRIMIPIQDEKGDFIAFGARALEDNQNPKYLNSPDTLVFNKSRSLFALYQAKQSIKEQDSVIIMEGFFDVISAHTHGLTNVVATLGTALTEQHIKILARYSDSRRMYLAFDSDEAGINATDRGAEIIKTVFSGLGDVKQFDENFAEISDKNNRSVCEIRVISNTTGKDPDEFIRTEGLDAYKKVVNQAPLLIDYQI